MLVRGIVSWGGVGSRGRVCVGAAVNFHMFRMPRLWGYWWLGDEIHAWNRGWESAFPGEARR